MSAGPQPWLRWGLIVTIVIGAYALAHRLSQSPLTGQVAPDFGLEVVAGEPPGDRPWFKLSDFVGRVVVLDFWAGWCGACRESTPMLNELADRFEGDGVAFVGVNVERVGVGKVRASHAAFGAAFPTVVDLQGSVQRAYAVRSLPTIIVVDRGGVVSYASIGAPREGKLSSAISMALE